MEIKISNLFRIKKDVTDFSPDFIVSILDPDIEKEKIPTFGDGSNILQLFFYDDDDLEKQEAPVLNYLTLMVDFFNFIVKTKKDAKVLIHCHAGASRSPAAAYIFNSLYDKTASERELFENLKKITNKPWPNRYLIELYDNHFRDERCLLPELDQYRDQFPKRYSAYQRLNKKRGI